MASKQVDLPDIGKVTLTKRQSSRNIKLTYATDGSIKVSLPIYVPYQVGISFVKNKAKWLAENKPELDADIEPNDRIGKAHKVNFSISDIASKPSVRVTNTQINVTIPKGVSVEDKNVQETAKRGAYKALKKEANQLLPQRLSQIAQKNGFEYSSVEVKRLTSRWGSCSQHKDIILNIYLMQLPWFLIDYVLIHELVHTEHLNHSADFWKRFEQILPNAKALRKELRNHKTAVTPIK